MGVETSEPSENYLGEPVVIQEVPIDNDSHSLIGEGLQEMLDRMKGKDTIQVVIYLDMMVDDEEEDFGSSGGEAYYNDTYERSMAEISTNDPEFNYSIEGLPYEDKLALVDERRAQRLDRRG